MLMNYNSKLGRNIFSFSLPTTTCSEYKTKACDKYCYAKKGNFYFPQVKQSLERNLVETKDPNFVHDTIKYIRENYIRYVRIHASGEFYSVEYYDKWKQIAQECHNTKFLAYTRNTTIDFSIKPSNLIIYFSVDNTTKNINSTLKHKAYVINTKQVIKHMQKVPFKINARFCDSKCFKCKACFADRLNIAFKKH